jgi:hypothetical protein
VTADKGASLRDRATAVEPVPVSPLRDGIPSAWLSKVGDGVYAVFSAEQGRDIGSVERYYPTLERGHNAAGCPARRWTARRAEWKAYFGPRYLQTPAHFRTRRAALEWVIAQAIEARRAETAQTGSVHESAVRQDAPQTPEGTPDATA